MRKNTTFHRRLGFALLAVPLFAAGIGPVQSAAVLAPARPNATIRTHHMIVAAEPDAAAAGLAMLREGGSAVDAVIAAQAGWSEKAVTEMVATYAHAVDERRLDELEAAFQMQAQTQEAEIPLSQ